MMRRLLLTCLLPLLIVGCLDSSPSNSGPGATTNPSAATPASGNSTVSNAPPPSPVSSQSPTVPTKPSPTAAPLKPSAGVTYKTQALGNYTVHIVTVPANGGFVIKPAIAPDLQTIGQFAKSGPAIAAINGGFFDPQNQQTTSYVVMNRQTVADPKQNPQLTENPKLKPYLRQILDRSEFRRYDCAGKFSYGILAHSKPAPEGCQIVDAVGGGPQLLPDLQAQREGFIDPELGRDAIGSQVPNARSAIGITKNNDILLVMVAQKQPKTGVTLTELATLMQSLGAESAMNLDGGSSAAMFYDKAISGSVNEAGNPTERAVKSAIVVVKAP